MLFEFIRGIILPFNKILPYVPTEGQVIDIGCGHGVLSVLLAKDSTKRKILGIDPATDKILEANKKIGDLKNLKFKKAYASEIKPSSFDIAVMADVLCLLPDKEKSKLVREVRNLLKSGGIFVLKETDTKPRWMYYWMVLEETLMVTLLKFTYSDYNKIYLVGKEKYKSILKSEGFKLIKTKAIRGLLPYPHTLFVAKKIKNKKK